MRESGRTPSALGVGGTAVGNSSSRRGLRAALAINIFHQSDAYAQDLESRREAAVVAEKQTSAVAKLHTPLSGLHFLGMKQLWQKQHL